MILHFGNGVERFLIPSVHSTISSIISEIAKLGDGKHAFDHGVFANEERPICRNQAELIFESNERYIDIQMLLNGEERILVEEREKLPVSMPYDESRDLMLHGGVEELDSWTSIL